MKINQRRRIFCVYRGLHDPPHVFVLAETVREANRLVNDEFGWTENVVCEVISNHHILPPHSRGRGLKQAKDWEDIGYREMKNI